MAECKRCKAKIVWLKTEAGNNMPVDAPVGRKFTVGEIFDPKKHMAHWATCPFAAEFRKKHPEPPKPTEVEVKQEQTANYRQLVGRLKRKGVIQ